MSRFFKSAAFPILIVIVLAFFASKLISGQDRANQYKFGDFIEQLEEGQVEQATLRTKDNSLEVVGSGAVTVVDPGEIEYTSMDVAKAGDPVTILGVRLHVLAAGGGFDLETRKARSGVVA